MATMPTTLWTYRARVQRIVDADTAVFEVDVGFHLTATIRARFAGIDAPERGTPEGTLATAFTTVWVANAVHLARDGEWPVTVRTAKTVDSFGRWLITIWRSDGNCLNDDLVASGNAVVYPRPKPIIAV